MSLQTTEAQAAARAAEAAWSVHRKTCWHCGNRQRGRCGRCEQGGQLFTAAAELRNAARESARMDAMPTENEPTLF